MPIRKGKEKDHETASRQRLDEADRSSEMI